MENTDNYQKELKIRLQRYARELAQMQTKTEYVLRCEITQFLLEKLAQDKPALDNLGFYVNKEVTDLFEMSLSELRQFYIELFITKTYLNDDGEE